MNEIRPDEAGANTSGADVPEQGGGLRELLTNEDWWAVWIGAGILLVCLIAVFCTPPRATAHGRMELGNPLQPWLDKPGAWLNHPAEAFYKPGKRNVFPGLIGAFMASMISGWRRFCSWKPISRFASNSHCAFTAGSSV